eukprot:1846730-Rhodomonas_salina.2
MEKPAAVGTPLFAPMWTPANMPLLTHITLITVFVGTATALAYAKAVQAFSDVVCHEPSTTFFYISSPVALTLLLARAWIGGGGAAIIACTRLSERKTLPFYVSACAGGALCAMQVVGMLMLPDAPTAAASPRLAPAAWLLGPRDADATGMSGYFSYTVIMLSTYSAISALTCLSHY